MEKTHQIQSLMVTEEVYRLRELDATVAAEVFGWEDVKYGPGKDFQGMNPTISPNSNQGQCEYVREYSSTWYGSGFIFDWLREQGLQFVLFSEEGEVQIFTFEIYREGMCRVSIHDENPHKAISLAVLEAKSHMQS